MTIDKSGESAGFNRRFCGTFSLSEVESKGSGQRSLGQRCSGHASGSFYRGFENGYVARYYGPGSVPALAGGVQRAVLTAEAVKRAAPPPPPNPYTADTQVYVREVSTFDPE